MAKATNKLTDTEIRNAKPKERPYKLSDGAGLYLLIEPSGNKYWRLAYRFGGKQKVLALGFIPRSPQRRHGAVQTPSDSVAIRRGHF